MVIFLYNIASRFCSKEITQKKSKLSMMMYRGNKRITRLITASMSLFSPKLIYRVKLVKKTLLVSFVESQRQF